MALEKGQYVRMLIAPQTRMGTIEGSEERRGRVMYIFRQDTRLKEIGPMVEIFVGEDEVEPCARQSNRGSLDGSVRKSTLTRLLQLHRQQGQETSERIAVCFRDFTNTPTDRMSGQ